MKLKKALRDAVSTIMVLSALFALMGADTAHADNTLRGVWVSTVYNIDYPSHQTKDAEALKYDADTILDKCSELGFNAVFLQVRPTSDAIYNSEIFPYSRWITGEEGAPPDGGFDVLSYWIGAAHSRGIELHAWINPYRITTGGNSLDSLAQNNPARLHPEYTFQYTNGNYYYNPALPEVRQLIVDGITEIADNYDVDGIHFDDYFYPGSEMDDYADYMTYNEYGLTIEDWRRSNCDALIKDVSDALRARGVTFGISPSGIWANNSYDSRGSDTRGTGSYSHLFADTRKWAVEGWIDYIVPQIYWEIGHPLADYETLANWWCDTLEGSDTKLYIGMADYKSEDAEEGSAWENGAALIPEFELNDTLPEIDGEVHFSFSSVISNAAVEDIIRTRNSQSRDDGVSVYVDGEKIEFDQQPIIENGRTLVPMRMIFEALGMTVNWNGETGRITATDGLGTKIIMYAGEDEMYATGKYITLDVPPKIVNDRTLVPVRAISESIGALVEWDGETKTVYITN